MKKISVVLPVLAPTPFLRAMTEFSIRTLREHADSPFELVLVEAVDDYFDPNRVGWGRDPSLAPDKYLRFEQKRGCIREFNAGADASSGEFIVSTGNDVFVPPHWDTELLRCFEARRACGVASLSALAPGAVIGPPEAQDAIVEGMYSPFMMYRREWRLDEAFVKIYADSDLIMRVYESGKRAFRSCRAHVHHLARMTSDRVDPGGHARDLARDERLFYQRWGRSPLMMFGLIRYGQWAYGRELESLRNPIHLHYDPTRAEG